MHRLFSTVIILALASPLLGEQVQVSGIYPHLTMWNQGGECGTGAVVPWQGSLWAVTYSPHCPAGSTDKLYEITPDLQQRIFPGSIGGTPANRMIHSESNQLLIGPYLIDNQKRIRVLPNETLFGRLTGNARHLTDPANKVYYATMEEGFYEVDVRSLEVRCFIRDGNGGAPEVGLESQLPGYHGKGLYSGQGRVVYANNGERNSKIRVDPTITSGALAEWRGEGDWQLVRRNQFTEVTGPGGIRGNPDPAHDPIWSLGWDARSLILALLDDGRWHFYRLPKGSHSYDGSHGWNTEWPRIRDIGEEDLLASMHGTFWRFPRSFSQRDSAGIAPRSNYLKVVGDFCRWNDRIVLGCDDSAASEFLNARPLKAKRGGPVQSNSNLWFISPSQLDRLGPVIGRGSVWLRDTVAANQPSDPYLFAGYDYRQIHLTHGSAQPVTFTLEVDSEGHDTWRAVKEIQVAAGSSASYIFDAAETGAWIRVRADRDAEDVTVNFQYRNREIRCQKNAAIFAGLATNDQPMACGGLMRSVAYDRLGMVATDAEGHAVGYYELNPDLELIAVDAPQSANNLVAAVRPPSGVITVDDASVILEEGGNRYRFPKNERYRRETNRGTQGEVSVKKEIEDYLAESLAIGATVSVSSTHEGYRGELAVDGRLDDDSRWISSMDGEKWIELDLGTPKTFRSVGIVTGWKHEARYAASNLTVQAKEGQEWKTLPGGEVRNNSSLNVAINLPNPVTAQHVRLESTDGGYLRIYEVGLFNVELDMPQPIDAPLDVRRVCREVATERDLLNVHGTFYELPATNAQGMAKIRPIATHNLDIHDFCSHNGLLLFTGLDDDARSEHIFRSEDGRAAVWAGVVDDLWQLGKPRGSGGPWKHTAVTAGEPSDPYLMTAYDRKTVSLSHDSDDVLQITLQVDIDGTGLWIDYQTFAVPPGETLTHDFPEGFSAYWIRAISERDAAVTVQFDYQ